MTGIHRVVDRRAIRRSVNIGDERPAGGRLRWVYYRNRPLREKNGDGASDKKGDSDAENRHEDSIGKKAERELPDCSAGKRYWIENHYAALDSGV
jgi:hypothetical protein